MLEAQIEDEMVSALSILPDMGLASNIFRNFRNLPETFCYATFENFHPTSLGQRHSARQFQKYSATREMLGAKTY
jgi:hypothetical protein